MRWLPPGIHQRATHLVEDEITPMKSYDSSVVEVDEQATSRPAEQGVGVGHDRTNHLALSAPKTSSSRSAPSSDNARR